jgi:hypothetical protein
MPNAWRFYIIPLTISSFFFLTGLGVFLFGVENRDAPRKPAKSLGVLLMLIGGPWALSFLFTSPTPRARQRLFDRFFHMPPEQIQRFVIKAGKSQQGVLTSRADVTIDDPATVRRIAEHLNAAREFSPSHPHSRWFADVQMVTRDATYFFMVNAPDVGDRNGTGVNVSYKPDGGGWNLGDFRADGLEAVLENAVQHPATTRSSK